MFYSSYKFFAQPRPYLRVGFVNSPNCPATLQDRQSLQRVCRDTRAGPLPRVAVWFELGMYIGNSISALIHIGRWMHYGATVIYPPKNHLYKIQGQDSVGNSHNDQFVCCIYISVTRCFGLMCFLGWDSWAFFLIRPTFWLNFTQPKLEVTLWLLKSVNIFQAQKITGGIDICIPLIRHIYLSRWFSFFFSGGICIRFLAFPGHWRAIFFKALISRFNWTKFRSWKHHELCSYCPDRHS